MMRRKKAAMLIGGQVVGQLSLLLAIPILTRVFGPTELGQYQMANAIALVLQAVATLRVEFVIPVTTSRKSVSSLLRKAVTSTSVTVLLLIILALICLAIGANNAAEILGMTAALTIVYAWMVVDNAVLIRDGENRRLATRNLFSGILSAAFQIFVALVFPVMFLVVLAILVGRTIAILLTRTSNKTHLSNDDGAAEESGYGFARLLPTVSAGVLTGMMLQSLTLISSFFLGPAAAGYAGIAQRIAGTPASLIGQGVAQVVQGSLAPLVRSNRGDLGAAVIGFAIKLSMGAAAVAVAIAVIGPLAAVPVLGPGWELAGTALAILAVPVSMQIVVAPLNPVLVMIGKEVLLLRIQIVRLSIGVGACVGAVLLTGDFVVVVVAYAVATVVTYIASIYIIVDQSKKFDERRINE
jgi:O-antigen/teichoic acid export membrane protein